MISGLKPEYRILSDFPAVVNVSVQWNELVSASPCNQAFASAEWYVASCRLRNFVPHAALAMCGTKILSILPVALNAGQGAAVFPHDANDYNDMIAQPEHIHYAACLLKHVVSSGNCRNIILSRLKPDSICLQAVAALRSASDIAVRCREVNIYQQIELPVSFDQYLSTRSQKFRAYIKRVLRNASNAGFVMQELGPEHLDPSHLADLFIRLALSRQKDKSFFQSAYAQSFVQDVIPELFSRKKLRVLGLIREGKIVALDMYTILQSGWTAWNGGFLPEVETWSPGTVLLAFGVQRAIQEGLYYFDFGEGKETYKTRWTNSSYSLSEVELDAEFEREIGEKENCRGVTARM
jgi:CelD/BcsL family acetyltransferase involved in cellulose biosynthesis